MVLLTCSVFALNSEVIDVRTFKATADIRLQACRAAIDEANEWANTSTNLVFDKTTTRIEECECEVVEAKLSSNEAVAEVERAYGLDDSYFYCLVKLEVMAEED